MNSKAWYTSKLLWSAVLYAAVAVAKYVGVEGAEAGQLDPLLERLGMAVAVGGLRAITDKPIHFGAPKDGQ